MAKATHRGTCQWCGSVQKLPSGLLSIQVDNVGMLYHVGRAAGFLELEAEMLHDGDFQAPRDLRTDSMGLGMVIY